MGLLTQAKYQCRRRFCGVAGYGEFMPHFVLAASARSEEKNVLANGPTREQIKWGQPPSAVPGGSFRKTRNNIDFIDEQFSDWAFIFRVFSLPHFPLPE